MPEKIEIGVCFFRPDVLTHPGPAGAPAIVLQHGIYSSEGTWTSYMESQLEGAFQPSAMLIPTLSSTSSLDYQIEELKERMISSGVSQAPSVVVVGHSQGGLIARRLGQEIPGFISGIVTIGSPNLGAPLFNNTENAIWGAIGGAVFGAEVPALRMLYAS